jgi:hypothetical protein
MSDNNTMLKRLLEQETALKQKIKEAKKQDEKRKAHIQTNKAKIIGMAILAEIETNQPLKQSLQPFIDRHIKNTKDRKMLGLPPLKSLGEPINDKGQENQNHDVNHDPEITQAPEEKKQVGETKAFWKG